MAITIEQVDGVFQIQFKDDCYSDLETGGFHGNGKAFGFRLNGLSMEDLIILRERIDCVINDFLASSPIKSILKD